ncbi:MAG: hypothetical protein IJI85_04725 [Clostridia bacterium]|nr:hypothetical protein [Clostridia bacterium]
MYALHAILVNIPDVAKTENKNLETMTQNEIKEMVIDYATEETECFYGPVFDNRWLLEEVKGYEPVIFSREDWSYFEEMLLAVDRDQKNEAMRLLDYLKEQTESTELADILDTLLLANDRAASEDDVDPEAWKWDYLNQGAWALKQIASILHGDYIFESEFYDTDRRTALVPFIEQLKENPDDWALVQYEYHC